MQVSIEKLLQSLKYVMEEGCLLGVRIETGLCSIETVVCIENLYCITGHIFLETMGEKSDITISISEKELDDIVYTAENDGYIVQSQRQTIIFKFIK